MRIFFLNLTISCILQLSVENEQLRKKFKKLRTKHQQMLMEMNELKDNQKKIPDADKSCKVVKRRYDKPIM